MTRVHFLLTYQATKQKKPFNYVGYLKKCIESIVENTNVFFELIIVDNGSTDGTAEYLESELTSLIRSGMLRTIKNDKNLGLNLCDEAEATITARVMIDKCKN